MARPTRSPASNFAPWSLHRSDGSPPQARPVGNPGSRQHIGLWESFTALSRVPPGPFRDGTGLTFEISGGSVVPTRRRGKALERWEVSLVKAMLAERPRYNDQDILAYFTRPTRSINHRAISEIRTGVKHAASRVATAEELGDFLATWPNVDPQTGLNLHGDELLVKAREAMIAAVHVFNGAGLYFRSELFIVTAIIAWTYLHHAYYRREGVDYRHFENLDGVRRVTLTKEGAEKYLELAACIRHARCPLDQHETNNLEFLLGIRHEIEHRMTSRLDEAISAKLQACCINFNAVIKRLFGEQFGLERRLPIALQFATFAADQRGLLKRAINLPAHIETMMTNFQAALTEEQVADPRFAYRVLFVPKLAKRPSNADAAYELVSAESEVAIEANAIYFKDVERKNIDRCGS
jgi:hypothetical protein